MLAALGRTATLPANIAPFLAAVLGLLLLAHLATRRFAPGADGLLLPLAALLNGIGYVFIARLDEASRDPDGLAALQAVWTAMGIGAFVATLVVVRRARDLRSYKYMAMVAGVGLLMLPLAPIIGRSINGARIWVEIGPVGFQPGEFAKIALAVFFAGYLADNRELLGLSALHPKYLGPVIVAWGASLMVMFFQKDLGSSLLFFALFVVLLWVATGRGVYLLLGLAMFFGGATLAHSQFAHVQDRVDTWLNPWPEYRFAGNQVLESWFALAYGGITGSGLGLGSPQRIPVVETDFIFAAIGEELGLLRRHGGDHRLRADDRPGLARRHRRRGPLREAPGHGPHHPPRAAGVHDHGGRHAAPAPHRRHPAVRQLRRVVAAGQLHPPGPADAHQPRRRPSGGARSRAGHGTRDDDVNRQITRLGIGLLACYLALFAMVNYVQVARSEELKESAFGCYEVPPSERTPETELAVCSNTRDIVRDFDPDRGEVLTADGVVIARTEPAAPESPFEFQRDFPTGDLFAHIAGFLNFNFGADGVEREFNDELAGQDHRTQYQTLSDLFVDRSRVGDVTITLRNDLQQLARDALGDQRGSVVALDPAHGSILAMWSFPSYDPNPLSCHDQGIANAARRRRLDPTAAPRPSSRPPTGGRSSPARPSRW